MKQSLYRLQAERARRAADAAREPELRRSFAVLARNYQETAEDLEHGRAVPRHLDLIPIGSREADLAV